MSAAYHFVFFHGEVDFCAARIPKYVVESSADGVFEQLPEQIIGADGAGRVAFRRLLGFDDVSDRIVRRVFAHVEQYGFVRRGADPGELADVELDFFASDELVHVDVVLYDAEGNAVGFGDIVDVVGSHQ